MDGVSEIDPTWLSSSVGPLCVRKCRASGLDTSVKSSRSCFILCPLLASPASPSPVPSSCRTLGRTTQPDGPATVPSISTVAARPAIVDNGRMKPGRSKLVLALLAGLLPSALSAETQPNLLQFYRQVAWTEDEGLPQNATTALAQTPDGYLWIGTEVGLVRFDGVRFELFNHDNTPALTADLVLRLLVDHSGTLWVGTRGGGVITYRDRAFASITSAQGLASDEVWALMESADGSVWIGTRSGLHRMHEGALTRVELPNTMKDCFIRSLVEDRRGRVWVGTFTDGLAVLTRKGDRFEAEHNGFAGEKINVLFEDRSGTMWMGTVEHGVVCLDRDRPRAFNMNNGLNCNYVSCIYEDRNSNLWIGTYGGGINVVEKGVGHITIFDTERQLTSNLINTILEDREKTIWLATEGGGINSLRDVRVRTYTKHNGLANDIVFGVFEDSHGAIWTGTIGFGASVRRGERFETLNRNDGLPSNEVVSFCEGPDGSVWLGTLGGGVSRLGNGTIRTYSTKDGLSDSLVRALLTDRRGRVWAGTDKGGIHQLDGDRFKTVASVGVRINSIIEDGRGGLWVCTFGKGLVHVVDDRVEANETEGGSPIRHALCAFVDEDGSVWIGTTNEGLWHRRGGRLRCISIAEGLPDKTAYAILADRKHNLWLSSNRGILTISRQAIDDFLAGKSTTVSVLQLGKEDGMRSLECNGGSQPAAWRSRDGSMWFPTIRGLCRVEPDTISSNKIVPPLVIERLEIDGREYAPDQPADVPAGTGDLDVQFTALSFIAPRRVAFKYKLEGHDDDWVDAGTRRSAHYGGLSPGSFRFRVIACNSDGLWNNTGAAVSFHLQPPFHQTTTFAGIVVAGVALLILATYLVLSRRFVLQKIHQKYQGSPLGPDEASGLLLRLVALLEDERVYRDPNLTIGDLAEKLRTSPRLISQVIHEHLHSNFYELVNLHRIKEAQLLLLDPRRSDATVLDVAYSVGFNSKSAFNRAFKSKAGVTPSEFRRRGGCDAHGRTAGHPKGERGGRSSSASNRGMRPSS